MKRLLRTAECHPANQEELKGKECEVCKKKLDNMDPQDVYKVSYSGCYFCSHDCYEIWRDYESGKWD